MKLYYHHVGGNAGTRDLHRTVFQEVRIDTIESALPGNHIWRTELLSRLYRAFPNGTFNVWGVPFGAKSIVGKLESGDAVLLVEQASEFGEVPALCMVDVYIPEPFPTISETLWKSDRFPYVFFFETKLIDLRWRDFQSHIGLNPRYNPRGLFSSIATDRLSHLNRFGGVEGYLKYLIRTSPSDSQPFIPIDQHDLLIYGIQQLAGSIQEVNDVLDSFRYLQEDEPSLTGDAEIEKTEVHRRVRDAAFSVAVRRAYENRCGVCGDGLHGPNGEIEVQAAHIFPKRLDGSDDIRNGISLCRKHHWAFDVGWMTIDDDYTIRVRGDLPRNDEYDFIRDFDGKTLTTPTDGEFSPHPKFLKEHRALYEV